MSDTRDFLLEEVKYLLKDIDTFLSLTLKKEKLKKENVSKRGELAQQITSVLSKIDKILPQEEPEEYADVEVEPEPPAPVEEDGELYEDTAVPDSPNKNMMSQGSDKDNAGNDNDVPEASEHEESSEPYGDMKVGPIAATDLNTPTREGFLEKRRKEGQLGIQQWQRRYCVIKDNVFYYFKNRNDKQQRNVIVLNGYEARPAPDFDKKNKKKDCIFEVICPAKRSYQFIAQNVDEMKAWIDAVAAASMVIPLPEPCAKSTPESSAGDVGFKDSAERFDNPEDFGETYEDVDSYQKTPVGKRPEEDTHNSESGSMIYDDAETALIEEEMDEVYEDVSSQPAKEPPVPHRLPTHLHKPLPTEPPVTPPAPFGKPPPAELPVVPPPVPSHTLMQPTSRLPPVPVHRPKPELPKRQIEEKPAPPPPGQTESWEEDYENIYMGLWDCQADDENELEFRRGDLVHIISKKYDTFNWWIGEKNNKVGLVPKQYLMTAYLL